MIDATYRIVSTPFGGFRVEVTDPGEAPRQTNDFASIGAAYSWIDQDKERATAPRRWWRLFSRRRRRN